MGIEGTLFQDIERNQFIWHDHAQRMGDERLPKKVINAVYYFLSSQSGEDQENPGKKRQG